MAFCTRCGNTLAADNGFCGKCGAAKFTEPSPPIGTKKRFPLIGKIVLGSIAVLFGLALIGALLSPEATKPAATAESAIASSESSTEFVPDAEERVYLTRMVQESKDVGESLNRFSELAASPEIFDNGWKTNIVIQLAIWKAAYSDVQQITPPPRLATVHAIFLRGLSKLDTAAEEVAHGMDDNDATLIDEAKSQVASAGQDFTTAAAQMPQP